MSGRIEPADLGLRQCAACAHSFSEGEPYHRAAAAGRLGLTLFIVCSQCYVEIRREPDGKLAVELDRYIAASMLAGAPAGGAA